MNNTPIEDEIRKYYQVENGEWLVEKGKVKEAKLLKEAVQRINALKREVTFYFNKSEEYRLSIDKKYEEREKYLKEQEEKLEKREFLLKQRLQSAKIALSYLTD